MASRKGGKTNDGPKRKSKSSRAGLEISVARVKRYMKKGRYAPHIGDMASVYLASVMEYCLAELLEISGNATKDKKKKVITPRYIKLGIDTDDEMSELLKNVTIIGGGASELIHSSLIPHNKKKKKSESEQNKKKIQDQNKNKEKIQNQNDNTSK